MAKYLIDTNVILRGLEVDRPMGVTARESLKRLSIQQEPLFIVPQTIYEFWNVSTCPIENNGFGFTTQETQSIVNDIEQNFFLKLDSPDIYHQWKKLVEQYQVKGVKVHDTRLVAACLVHGLTHILTFNTRDFKRFQSITAVHPENIM